jgi:hypothetical protein
LLSGHALKRGVPKTWARRPTRPTRITVIEGLERYGTNTERTPGSSVRSHTSSTLLSG